MNLIDLIKSRRSIRLFKQAPIEINRLKEIVDSARFAPCGANVQALEYILINEDSLCEKLFPELAWAANVKPKRNPPINQRPKAYVIALVKQGFKSETLAHVDAAAAIENMLLSAWSMGIGSCWLGAINRNSIRKKFNIPDSYIIDSVVAFGYPDEKPVAVGPTADMKYFLDENDVLNVPKRRLNDICHLNSF